MEHWEEVFRCLFISFPLSPPTIKTLSGDPYLWLYVVRTDDHEIFVDMGVWEEVKPIDPMKILFVYIVFCVLCDPEDKEDG